MSSLEETLPRLSDAVPLIGTQLEDLLGESADAQTTAQALLGDVERKKAEATGLFEQVRQVLAAFDQEAADAQSHLQDAVGSVEGALEAATQGLEAAQGEASQAQDAAVESMTGLESDLAGAGPIVNEAEGEIRTAMGELGEAIRAGQEELARALDAATGEADSLEQAVQEARDTVRNGLAGLRGRLVALLDEGRARLDQTAGLLEQLQSDHQTALSGHLASLAAESQIQEAEVEGRIESDVKEPVAAAVRTVLEALGELDTALSAARDSARAERGTLDAAFENLREAMEPMPAGIDSVKRAAELVNIPW